MVKLFLYRPRRHISRVQIYRYTVLSMAVDGRDWTASSSYRFTGWHPQYIHVCMCQLESEGFATWIILRIIICVPTSCNLKEQNVSTSNAPVFLIDYYGEDCQYIH